MRSFKHSTKYRTSKHSINVIYYFWWHCSMCISWLSEVKITLKRIFRNGMSASCSFPDSGVAFLWCIWQMGGCLMSSPRSSSLMLCALLGSPCFTETTVLEAVLLPQSQQDCTTVCVAIHPLKGIWACSFRLSQIQHLWTPCTGVCVNISPRVPGVNAHECSSGSYCKCVSNF